MSRKKPIRDYDIALEKTAGSGGYYWRYAEEEEI